MLYTRQILVILQFVRKGLLLNRRILQQWTRVMKLQNWEFFLSALFHILEFFGRPKGHSACFCLKLPRASTHAYPTLLVDAGHVICQNVAFYDIQNANYKLNYKNHPNIKYLLTSSWIAN